jgi:hypothetical protein
VALRGGALRGLVTRGTRTRCLLAIGAAQVFTGVLSMATGRPSRPGARWLAAVVGCAMLVISGHASGASAAGVVLAPLASFCYAVYAVIASYLITNGAGDRAVVGAIFGGAAVLLMPALFTSPMSWVATGPGLAVATYLAVLTTALAYLLYARGRRSRRGPQWRSCRRHRRFRRSWVRPHGPTVVHVPARIAVRSPQASWPAGRRVSVLPLPATEYVQVDSGSVSVQKPPWSFCGYGG